MGVLLAIANGGVFPAFSIFLSKMLAVLINFSTDPAKAREDTNLYALIFFIIEPDNKINLMCFFFHFPH